MYAMYDVSQRGLKSLREVGCWPRWCREVCQGRRGLRCMTLYEDDRCRVACPPTSCAQCRGGLRCMTSCMTSPPSAGEVFSVPNMSAVP